MCLDETAEKVKTKRPADVEETTTDDDAEEGAEAVSLSKLSLILFDEVIIV